MIQMYEFDVFQHNCSLDSSEPFLTIAHGVDSGYRSQASLLLLPLLAGGCVCAGRISASREVCLFHSRGRFSFMFWLLSGKSTVSLLNVVALSTVLAHPLA